MLNIAENTYLSDLILDLEGVCVFMCVCVGYCNSSLCVRACVCAVCVCVCVEEKKKGKNRKKRRE